MMIDEAKFDLYAHVIAMREIMLKTLVRSFQDTPPAEFDKMLDAWRGQLNDRTYPHLGAELSDALAGEVQDVMADMLQDAKLFRAELERLAAASGTLPNKD